MTRRTKSLLFAGSLFLFGSCASDSHDGMTSGHSAMPVAAASVMGQPDQPITGPQGRVGQFVVECPFSHALSDDPILYPTLESLLDQGTTCEQREDTASYWAPALLDKGQLIVPVKSVAYYRAGLGVDPTSVVAFPAGLMMIAGDPMATEAQPTSVVAWTCGNSSVRDALPPSCPADNGLRLDITFPDCWDGKNLDVAGHRTHMYYSSSGECPKSHPVAVPQLIFSVAYPVHGDASKLQLASGSLLTGHADFVNSWDQEKLEDEVELCIGRDVVCGVTSG
jgi:hypothetical protein